MEYEHACMLQYHENHRYSMYGKVWYDSQRLLYITRSSFLSYEFHPMFHGDLCVKYRAKM